MILRRGGGGGGGVEENVAKIISLESKQQQSVITLNIYSKVHFTPHYKIDYTTAYIRKKKPFVL